MKTKDKPGFYELFYIFLFACLFGYVVEGLWSYYRFRTFINHTSLVIGPFDMVYGAGAVLLSIVLYRYKSDNIIKLFILSFIVGSISEYVISYSMEKLVGFVAWNYSRYPFNINGRICLRYSIFWGLLGIAWIKLIYPKLLVLISKIPRITGDKVLKFLMFFMTIDWALTFIAVYRAQEVDRGIPPRNKFEEVLDNTFNRDYLNNMYNNRWNKK